MATKSAGRVSIRVVPDSTRFREDLKKSLERIERQMRAKIETELYISRATLAKLKRQIESLVVRIKPTIDLSVSSEEIAQLKAQIERMRPQITIDLNTRLAATRLAALSRTRSVDLFVNLRNSSALTGFIKRLEGLAGLNVVGDMFTTGIKFFQDIDRNAVKLGTLFTKMGAIAALSGTLLANVVAMVSQLASIGNIGLLAPAFFTGIGISVGVLVAALKDASTVLADLKPAFAKLQDDISSDFWKEAATPIRDLVNYLMPILDNPNGTSTARSLGQLVGEIANQLKEILTVDKLNTMFDRMNRSIDILKGAVKPLTNAFVNLGLHGSKYFERFSTWIVKVSNQFDAFITRSAENGDLDRWTENAIQGMKDLGNTTRGLVRIFAALNRAAVASGAINWGQFAAGLNATADAMNSPRFQDVATKIFGSMRSAVEGIVEGIKKLGPAIETATPQIVRAFEAIGIIASTVGGMLATVISNPEFLKGVDNFIAGVTKGFQNLEPAAKPFAESLGNILTIMGKIFDSVTQLITHITVSLGPVLDEIGAHFATLIDPLNASLTNLVNELKPVLESFSTNVVGPVVTFIKDELLPAFDKIVKIVAPEVKAVFKEIGDFVKGELTTSFKFLNDELDKVKPNADEGKSALETFMTDLPKWSDPKALMPGLKGGWFTKDGAENWKEDWGNFVRPFNEAIYDWFGDFPKTNQEISKNVTQFLSDAGRNIDQHIKDHPFSFTFDWDVQKSMDDFGKFSEDLSKRITDGIDDFLGDASRNNQGFEEDVNKWFDDNVFNPIKAGWEGMWADLGKWYEDIKKGFQDFMSGLLGFNTTPSGPGQVSVGGGGAGGKGTGATQKLTPEALGFGDPKTFWTELGEKWRTSIEEFFTQLGENIKKFGEETKKNWDEFWGGLGTKIQEVWDGIVLWIQTKSDEIKTNVETWAGEVKTKWDEFWNGIKTKIDEIWQGIVDWINTKSEEIKTNVNTWAADVKKNWDEFWTGIGKFLEETWNKILKWIDDKIREIKSNIEQFGRDVKTNWDNFWKDVNTKVENAWKDINKAIEDGINDAVEWVRGLPGRAMEALGELGEKLKTSGGKLIQGFIDGMNGMINDAKRTAEGIVKAITDFFPHSPAKKGPLSGRGYTTYSGRALVKDFAGGMMDNMNLVRKATDEVMKAVELGSNLNMTADLDKDGVVIDRRETNLNVYYPVAEPTSRTIEKAANQLRMAKAI